jgi:hypothetical protein
VLRDRNDAAHTERFTPLQAMASHQRLWGRPGCEGILPRVFHVLEPRLTPGTALAKYRVERVLLSRQRLRLIEVVDQHMGYECFLSLVPGDFGRVKTLSQQFDRFRAIVHKNLLRPIEWMPLSRAW